MTPFEGQAGPLGPVDRRDLFTEDGLFHTHPEVQAEDLRTQIQFRAEQLQQILSDAKEKHNTIRGKQTLTPEGKIEAIDELMNGVISRVKGSISDLLGLDIYRSLNAQRMEILSPERRLELPPEFKFERQTCSMEQETRAELRKLDDLDRRQILFEAVEDDDRITLRAFHFAPPRFPLVKADELKEAAELHARRRFPEKWERYEQIQNTWDVLRGNFSEFVHVLRGLAGRGSDRVAHELAVENFLPAEVTEPINRYLDPDLARPVS